MLKTRIIRIAAAAGALAIWTGCTARLDPAIDSGAICFQAGSDLLRDDATKSDTPKTGTSFTSGDQLAVYGWHNGGNNGSGQLLTFGSLQPVTLGTGNVWTYSPLQTWEWDDTGSDFYDFLGLYLGNTSPSFTAPTSYPLTATIPYNATSAQYDLMAAGVRRQASAQDPSASVPLQFSHLLSAVRVVVKNSEDSKDDSGNPYPFTLKSYQFNNLYTGANVVVGFNNGSLTTTCNPNSRTTGETLGSSTEQSISPGGSSTELWDIMVPQGLSPLSSCPNLILSYSFQENGTTKDRTVPLPLKDILTRNNTAIKSWEAGHKYTYEVEIRLGGGIMVSVTTTEWETVQAETPGLMIR